MTAASWLLHLGLSLHHPISSLEVSLWAMRSHLLPSHSWHVFNRVWAAETYSPAGENCIQTKSTRICILHLFIYFVFFQRISVIYLVTQRSSLLAHWFYWPHSVGKACNWRRQLIIYLYIQQTWGEVNGRLNSIRHPWGPSSWAYESPIFGCKFRFRSL